ncbi:Lariat debranching enzyme [Thelohanellus kitauei]|uniref:Lariat debranching enzyme n=1 Tax=Thelohanellus kitauei TaxID=669202 RepID=A0A0C2JXJ6_THEKT|nr:Lariat debranching enzyme [Thelohanellus kitauei]
MDKMYRDLEDLEETQNFLIDLVICCGDFQSIRNETDLASMAVIRKHRKMGDFHKYYTGKATAPYLTIFVGGNHESSNYLWELPFGGWVAENIYYMGYSNVIEFMGIRIGGLSGIYKSYDYAKGHIERPPFNDNSIRSVYHIRHFDVTKMKMMKDIDILVSHDWPNGIWNHGDCKKLLQIKKHFTKDIRENNFGCKGLMEVLNTVKPTHYVCAHMHVYFPATVSHGDKDTDFMALDKPIHGRKYFDILNIESKSDSKFISYIPEWLAITKLYAAHHFKESNQLPNFTFPDKAFVDSIVEKFGDLAIRPSTSLGSNPKENLKEELGFNSQTEDFCNKLKIKNPCSANRNLFSDLAENLIQEKNSPSKSKE